MDFAIPDGAPGVNNAAALRTMRGADPLVLLPPGHILLRVAGVPLRPAPGGAALNFNCVNASIVEAVLMGAAYFDGRLSGAAMAAPVLTVMVRPTKLGAIMTQLYAEPAGIGLDRHRLYENLSDAAADVCAAASRLNPAALHPAYVITPADLLDLEPVTPGAGQRLTALCMGPNALTFGDLVGGDAGFAVHASFLYYCGWGRNLAASRDADGSAMKRMLGLMEGMAVKAGCLAQGSTFNGTALTAWMEATALPAGLQLLRENGSGAARREQLILDRQAICFGNEEQRERLVIGLLGYSPLKERVPNLLRVIGRGGPEADIRSCVQRMAQHLLGKGATVIVRISVLESLEAELKPLMHTLASPATALIRMDERVSLIAKAKAGSKVASVGGVAGDERAPGENSLVVSKIKVDVYADALAEAFNTEAWSSLDQRITSELEQTPVARLKLYEILMQAPFVGVRRAAMGYHDTSSAPLLRASQSLTRAIMELKDWGALVSNMLVCDMGSMRVTDPNLQRFRLEERVLKTLRRGGFDELDWVADILLPVMRTRTPGLAVHEFSHGLRDARVVLQLSPLLRRLSTALGLPVEPSTPHPGLGPAESGHTAKVSLCSLAATISAEALDIESHPSPFVEDDFVQLSRFETTAWTEAAELFHQEVVLGTCNPVGRPQLSILPDGAAALGVLAVMRDNKERRRREAYLHATSYELLSDFRGGKFGDRYANKSARGGSSGPKMRDRSRSPSVDPETGLEETQSKARRLSGENPCRHSTDRSRFWFASQDSGKRVSPVYDYKTLEKLGGKSRKEVCYPFLLSNKPAHRRMSVCDRPDEPGHRTFTSAAHVPPTADFLDQVHRHFRTPVVERSDTIGGKTGPTKRSVSPGKSQHLANPRSPHPVDARRSHGSSRAARSRSASPGERSASSRSTSPRGRAGREGRHWNERASRSASPVGDPALKEKEQPDRHRPRARSPPTPRSPSPSPKPTSADAAVADVARPSTSPRAKKQRTPGVRRVVWGAAAVAAPASANAMETFRGTARVVQGAGSLVDVSAPCTAAVRTLLFLVSMADPDEARFLLPAGKSSLVVGSISPLASPRVAAVAEAQRLLESLPFPRLCDSVLCLPVFESIPAADDVAAVVDRVVAAPLAGGVAALEQLRERASAAGWEWTKLSALTCVMVYALAATAAARLSSFSSSVPSRVLRVLRAASSRMRSGARHAKLVKIMGAEASPTPRHGAEPANDMSTAWREAIIKMRASDEALRRALLAVPATHPGAGELHAFADVIRPIDLAEIPPAILASEVPPDYSSHHLRLQPFSTRVIPPRTVPLVRPKQVKTPQPDFQPSSIHDLITPRWMRRVERWYQDLGEWLIKLAEVADSPDSPEAESVRRARPLTLVVPRSGFAPEAVDIFWDLTGDKPVPLDFDAPIDTHLNLQLVEQWRREWPDYPDQEIFSHLLNGVQFKIRLPYQLVLQPHLASLSYGFVNVHKELIRLMDKGCFSMTSHPPFVPWRTLPSGSAERKQEPGRPRRTEDGTAPRKGYRGAEFMVDADGVRTLSINLAASMPADDLQRGTHTIFYDAWERRLAGRFSPKPHRRESKPSANGRRAALLLFSGDGEGDGSLASQLLLHGVDIVEVDVIIGAHQHDMTREVVQQRVLELIRSAEVSLVFAAPPCESGSIATADSRPSLRSPSEPWGVQPVPKRWAAYLEKHNRLIRATAECLVAADEMGIPWMIENPALRCDPNLQGYWSRFENWGTLWHCFAELGIAPRRRLPPDVAPTLSGSVYETLVAACAFDAPHQKMTMFWSSQSCAPVRQLLEGKLCRHLAHRKHAHGVDERGWSLAKASAKYPARMAEQLARGFACVVAATPESPVLSSSSRPAPPDRRCGRCKHKLIQCDRCRQWCCETTGCFYVKCLCDLPEYADTQREDVAQTQQRAPVPVSAPTWSPREQRVTCSDMPAPPASRSGSAVIDINITLESSTPRLANPFLMGASGKVESMRQLAATTYASFLAQRTVEAGSCSNGLRVAQRLGRLTGEMVLREVERIVSKQPSGTRFHLVCRRSCTGKACHGRELCRLFDDVIQATQHLPFPKELKPTVPEILIDLAVLQYLSHHTGLPVIQIVSDVKDFFNQHALAPFEKPNVGLVTLDPRAIVEYAQQLRAMFPELRSILAHVLGYGLTPASNVCQRTAHLLTFIWLARMQIEARSIVAALAIQYPFIAEWLKDRRSHFQQSALRGYAKVSACQARLWTVSMYTDDGHHALLGVQLAVCGLQVWRDITGALKLQMAIIQKHGLGQQVTVQGVVINTGLGAAYVPTDKLRRTLTTLEQALHGLISVAEYRSLLGLLQSLMFIAGMSKTSMYGLYAPLQGVLTADPDEPVKVTPWMRDQLERWRKRLQSNAGSSYWSALPHLRNGNHDVLDAAPAVFFVRSDASKEGVGMAGLGGALGGAYWRYPERGPLDSRYLALPIAALEFIAYVGSVAAFASMIPEDAVLVSEVDALATADALTAEAAKSPLMQAIHLHLLGMPEFVRIAQRHIVAHIYGEANVVADAVSRDLGNVLQALAGQLNLRLHFIQPPECVPMLLDKMLGVADLAATSIGMHNPAMVGSPFAHDGEVGAPWIGSREGRHGAHSRDDRCEDSLARQPKVGGDAALTPATAGDVCGDCDNELRSVEEGRRLWPRPGAGGLKGRQAAGESNAEDGDAAPGGLGKADEEVDERSAGEIGDAEGGAAEETAGLAGGEEPDPGDGGGQEKCDCVTGCCKNRAIEGRRSAGSFAFCGDCRVDENGVSCSCDCGECHPEASIRCGPEIMGRVLCKCPTGLCVEEADRFEPEIQRFVCESCAISTVEGIVCTCQCFGCEPLEKVEHDDRAWCSCAKVFACANRVGGEGDERCYECSAGCGSEQRCSCSCVGCRAEAKMERDREKLPRDGGGRGDTEAGGVEESEDGVSENPRKQQRCSGATEGADPVDEGQKEAVEEEPVAAWRNERVERFVWRGRQDWFGRPDVTSSSGPMGVASSPPRKTRPQEGMRRRECCPPPPPPKSVGPGGAGGAVLALESQAGDTAPECRCGSKLRRCPECASPRCCQKGCDFITCVCDVEESASSWRDGPRSPDGGDAASGGGGAADGKRLIVMSNSPRMKRVSRSPGPAADGSAAEAVAEMLEADASALALNPARVKLRDLCRALYDTSTAQPERTSRAQASAWDHWVEWCACNKTSPWRLITPATEAERQREAVLMAGFLRFCHRRQSERPRAGRPAALVASATKALAHVRKVHKEKGFPMPDSALVLAQSKRLQLEYKSAHGIEAMQPQRKEPFTRKLVMDTLLLAPDGIDLGHGLTLRWESRFGRSLAGMVTTLMQTGFRKGEVTTEKRVNTCPAQCLSRDAVAWYLRGEFFPGERAPVEFLACPQRGDYVVLTPGPSKSDQLGLVWGGTPIWIPFEDNEPLCAFPALARIETHDACANRRETALFTYDDGMPLVSGHMDRVLQSMLLRDLPAKTARLYSWHSARIFLATALRASGASMDETQALCRWQTPTSLRIYARMNRERYGALVSGALKVEISSARARALVDAMPFLKTGGGGSGCGDLWSEDGDAGAVTCDPMELESGVREAAVGRKSGAEKPPKRRRAEPDEARRNLQREGRAEKAASKVAEARRASCAPGEAEPAAGRPRTETAEQSKKGEPLDAEATETSERRGGPVPCKAASRAPVQVSGDSACAQETTAEGRYGRVPYFPDDMAGYKTFFERPSTRRPPNRVRKEE